MLSRLKGKIDSLGWVDTVVFVLARWISQLSAGKARLVKYYFVAQPVAAAEHVGATAGSTRFYLAARADDTIAQAPRPAAVIHDRFAQNARCVVGARGDDLAGFIWLCPTTYREDDVRCVYRWSPTACAQWDFDVYVCPPFRMGRLFARLWACAHQHLRGQGVRWTLSRVDAFNAESLAAHRKLGATTLARTLFLRLGPMQVSLMTLSPYFHISMSDSDSPVLRFDLSRLDMQPLQAALPPVDQAR